jgi:signal transduction histidine kinase
MKAFHSAALKLTAWYLALIMAVSIFCSLALYHVSSDDLRRAVQRQINFYSQVLSPSEFRSFSKLRLSQLAQDQRHLKQRLVLFNVLVVVGGGFASYALARKTMRPLEESLEAQSRFTGDASHELRTPLTAMQTEIEVALRNPKLTKTEAVGLLQSSLEEVAKLKALSEGLLKLAGSTEELSLDQPVSLSEVVRAANQRVAKIARAKNIKVRFKTQDTVVRGDLQHLTDLTVILLDNAIKYSPAGSRVSIETGSRDKRAYVKVTDTGRGISADDLPRIFERFYRAESSRHKDQAGGYGLGLAIAKKIADLHHGSIEVRSTIGKGSTFTLRLPLWPVRRKA